MSEPLWRPSADEIAATRLSAFLEALADRGDRSFADYRELHRWSCEDLAGFWSAVWDFCEVVAERRGEAVVDDPGRMFGTRFFPEARLNFAENLLRGRGDEDAIVFRGEDRVRSRLSHDELRERVFRLARALEEAGIEPGDRVAAFMPNVPDTVVAMLATATLGAVFSSCSPDFGTQGVLDRFGQIEPRVLVCADGYWYKGRRHESLPRVAEILEGLPSVELVAVSGYLDPEPDLAPLADTCRLGRPPAPPTDAASSPEAIPGTGAAAGDEAARRPYATALEKLLSESSPEPLEYRQVGFNDPLYVLYSSGTTGPPKAIVHGVGGTLLKHLCEHQLMCDVRPADRVFYFTTCGWMMWNWLVTALASGATLLLYDGNPFSPGPEALFDYAEAEAMTLLGTSAKYIDALRNEGLEPAGSHDLSSVRTITSTGSPLVPEGFDYVYERVEADVRLSSISGGTDLVGCFVGGNPIGPVWRGEIQAPVLGMDVDVFDAEGNPVRQRKGELVCKAPFPSMPLRFWDDPGDERYRAAYFERYPGVWHHGDFAEITEHGGFVIHGRSDATLNPGGVRIGTAEIYRQVERLDEVEEALAAGQEWDDDERVVLFVKLRDGAELDDGLIERIRSAVREGASPRHVPAVVLQVPDIPRTKSGKIVELAVRDLIHGRAVENREALANPEALDHFQDRPELRC